MGKKLVGVDIGSYVFDASEKTITFSGVSSLSLDNILYIMNLTRKKELYDLGDNLGTLSLNVLTLDYDTTTMADTDELQIWIWVAESELLGNVKITDGTELASITSSNQLEVYQERIKLTNGVNDAEITASNEVKVLSTTSVSNPNIVKITDGVETADITALNELKVSLTNLLSNAVFTTLTDGTTIAGVTNNNQIKAQVELVDKNGKVIEFTAGGEIPVSNPPPTAPTGTTPVEIAYYSQFTTLDNKYYIIPNGYTLILQQFEAYGSYDSVKGMRAELWYQPNGNATGESIVTVIGINGMGNSRSTGKVEYVGDGTKRLALRTVVEGVGSRTRFIKVIGYLFTTT